MKLGSNTSLRKNSKHSASPLLIGAMICSALALTACGSGDSSESLPAYQGQSADAIATETLQRNASEATNGSMATALNSVVAAMNGSAALGQAFNVVGTTGNTPASPGGVFNDASQDGPLINAEYDTRMRTETSGAFGATLGLSGAATATRSGNKITVNPDEAAICYEQGYSSQNAQCEQLLSDLVVEINATSDKSGDITYLYRNRAVALVGYSPLHASYELKLDGLHEFLLAANQIGLTSSELADSMNGSVKLEARVLNATAGSEAGSVIVSVPQAVNIVNSSAGANVNLAPSTLMQMSANAATGDLAMEVNVGALALASPNEELPGSPLQKLVMSGLTAKASITQNGDLLTVSNVGLGNGPLSMTVDSLEAVRASMDTFGFVVDDRTNKLVLNGDLNFSMLTKNIFGVIDDFESHDATADINIQAASGTTFTELLSGVMRLDQGGPLVVGYDISDGISSANGTVSVGVGQCFGESYSSDAPIDVVGCN